VADDEVVVGVPGLALTRRQRVGNARPRIGKPETSIDRQENRAAV
jgi:hypothetical protein